jgi:hypothetical protein
MKYARVNLAKTNYSLLPTYRLIKYPDIELLNSIFQKYCDYKKFESVVPIFENQYRDVNTDIFGYYDKEELVAFTLVRRLDNINIENCQFAWDYKNPKLRLGIESLKNECAFYKKYGYRYMYLGLADTYKSELDGYEILGPL